MLEILNPLQFSDRTYRYQTDSDALPLLQEMDIDGNEKEELLALVIKMGEISSLEKVLDEACKPKNLLPVNGGRFSDGAIGVCYTALETETAQEEVSSFQCRIALRGMTQPVRLYYQQVSIDFDGQIKDLRPKKEDWPFLVSNDESGYPDCRVLAREAMAEHLDGLLSPSSRRPLGTCLPVFSRPSLQNPSLDGVFIFDYDPASGGIAISALA